MITDRGNGPSSAYESYFAAPPCDPTRRSVERAQLSPAVLPDIKVEMVKMEDVEHDEDSETDQYSQQEGQECHRVLTEDDVALEKIFKNEVIDSKSNLGFVSEQGSCVCDVCSKVFVDEDALYDHVYHECGKEQEMNCTLCSFRTEFIDDLRSHMMLKHKGLKIHSERPRPYCLKRHVKTQHSSDPLYRSVCPGCGRSYKHQDRLRKHLPFCEKSHDKIVKYKCFYCCHETTRKRYLKEHIRRKHSVEAINRVPCPKCGKSLKNKDNLRNHMKSCAKSDAKIMEIKCNLCNYETSRRYNLRKHIETVHSVREKDAQIMKLKCKFCNYETIRAYYLKKHMEKPHLIEATNRPVCPGCGKSYKHQDRLNRHIKFCEKSNNKIVKFKCFYCSHESTRKCYIRGHIRRIHPVVMKGPFTCRGCQKSYENEDYLKRHIKYCTKFNIDVIRHKCQICDFETTRPYYLKKHTAAHSRRTHLFSCAGCGKQLKNKDILRRHIKFCEKINEVVKLKCKFCHFETKRRFDLKRHVTLNHSVGANDRVNCSACQISLKNDRTLKKHMLICKNKINL